MFHFFIQSPAQGETWEGRRGTHSSAYLFWFVYTSPLLLCAIFAPIDHVLLFWFLEIYHIWWIFCEQVSNQTLLPYLTAMSWGSKLVYQELSYPNIKHTETEGCSDSWNVWLSECNTDQFPLQISEYHYIEGFDFCVSGMVGSFRKTGLLFVVSEFGTHTLASYTAKLELSACLKFSTKHLVPIWAGGNIYWHSLTDYNPAWYQDVRRGDCFCSQSWLKYSAWLKAIWSLVYMGTKNFSFNFHEWLLTCEKWENYQPHREPYGMLCEP